MLAALLLLALAPTTTAQVPDLQVAAYALSGSESLELTEALSRALVASGARVVLGGSTREPCPNCVLVVVRDLGAGVFRVEVQQEQRTRFASLQLGRDTQLLDRARAIAIQTRLLVHSNVPKPPKNVARLASHRPVSPGPPAERSVAPPIREATVVRDTAPVAVSAVKTPTRSASVSRLRDDIPSEVPSATTDTEMSHRAAAPRLRGPSTPVDKAPTKVAREEATANYPLGEEATEVAAQRSDSWQSSARWPWIPLTVGVAAAAGAVACGWMARQRYDALADRSRPYDQAHDIKHQGETLQKAAYVATGVAVVGLATGMIGFATSRKTPVAGVAPTNGGAIVLVSGGLP